MSRFSLLSAGLLAAHALAQGFSYADPNSGMTLQSYQDSDTGCQFGIALPETPDRDFIGQIVGGIPTLSFMFGLSNPRQDCPVHQRYMGWP